MTWNTGNKNNLFIEEFLDEDHSNGKPAPTKEKKPIQKQEPPKSDNLFVENFGVKKKEPSETISEPSKVGTQNIPSSPSQSGSVAAGAAAISQKDRYDFVENSDANSLIDDYKNKSKEKSLEVVMNPFSGSRAYYDYAQSREGKAGKILTDVVEKGNFNIEDINYASKVAPNATKQVIKSVLPDVEDKDILSEETIKRFADEGKKIVSNYILEDKVKNNQQLNLNVKEALSKSGINPVQLQNNSYADDLLNTLATRKKAELNDLEWRYPEKPLYSDLAGTHYKRENSGEYSQKKEEIENRYNELNNQIGLSKAYDFAQKNPTLTPIQIGEQWLKYADPDTYKLWIKAGRKGAIDRDMAEVGVRALYGTGNSGAAKLALADEDNLDYQYPDKIIAETYHRLGAELYKDENWFFNAARSVKELDKAAEQLPEKNRDIYYKFIRDREKRNVGTDVPMSGLVNKIGEGFTSTATETWKGLGDLLNIRSEKKVAQEALNEGTNTQYQDVGNYYPAVNRLKEIDTKQKKGEKLSPAEIEEKQDLETFAGVRSTAQEVIDGTGNLTGQVLFQAVGTKGLGAVTTKGIKALGLLKDISPAAGIGAEESIASEAANFGISKYAINELSASAIAYASSYDAAKRDAFRLMPDDKDAGKRTIYSTIVAGLNAGTERIFKDEKVLNAFNKEISPNIKTIVNKLSSGEISKEALAPAITKVLKESGAFLKEAAVQNTKESIEELAGSIGQSVATSILAPAKYNNQQAYDDAISTFTTTFLYGGLTSSAAAVNGYRANHISIPTIAKLGIDTKLTEDTKNYINAQVLNNNMSQQEANDKLKILNTASNINTKVMPQVESIGKLPQKAKEKYSVQLLNEKILNGQAEASNDPVLKSELEKKIKESEGVRKKILNKELFVDDDYSVKTLDEINGEQVVEEKEPTSDLLNRSIEKAGEGIKLSLDETKPEESLTFLKEQSLDTPNGLMSQLSNDEELTTDIIASNPKEDIQKSIDKYSNELKQEGISEQRIEEIDKHLSLLDKGLEKADLLTQTNKNEKISSQESGQEGSSQKSGEGRSQESSKENVADVGTVETKIAEAVPIFEQLSKADKSKISKKEKQVAINKVAESFGEDGKKAVFIHSNFDDIVKKLKENNKLEVKC